MKHDRKYHYDEQNGVFVFEDEISVNWLLTQVLNSPSPLQITKVSDQQIKDFFDLLSQSDLRMPNGQHALFWTKDRLKERQQQADSQKGESWHQTVIRYRYILERLDLVLTETENLHEKMEIKKQEEIKLELNKEPNNIKAYFEPI
jgi:hypothetical protein